MRPAALFQRAKTPTRLTKTCPMTTSVPSAVTADAHTLSDPVEIAVRLGVALALGLVLGLERELRGKEAGLKTMSLVSLGSAGFMLAGLQLAASTNPSGDPTRLISGLAAAIGFLGAGVIMQVRTGESPRDHNIRGLTTAATVFVAAAVGASSGAGLYWTAGLLTVGAAAVLVIIRQAEKPVRDEAAERKKDNDDHDG